MAVRKVLFGCVAMVSTLTLTVWPGLPAAAGQTDIGPVPTTDTVTDGTTDIGIPTTDGGLVDTVTDTVDTVTDTVTTGGATGGTTTGGTPTTPTPPVDLGFVGPAVPIDGTPRFTG